MPAKQVVQRSVASLGGVDMNWLKGGLREDDSGWPLASEGMSQLNNSNLIIDDNSTQSIQSIRISVKNRHS